MEDRTYPLPIKTDDGYTFYILESGRVVDSLDPDSVDMSWPTVVSFLKSIMN